MKCRKNILTDLRGSVAVYSGVIAMVAIGAGALAIDVGRMTVLKSEMQDRADSAALAGATQLDGRSGAVDRATQLAMRSTAQTTSIAVNGSDLAIQSLQFYSQVSPSLVPATGDQDAHFIRVTLAPKDVSFFFRPVFGQALSNATLTASATATEDPVVCDAPPLMMCDLSEDSESEDPMSWDNVGRQVLLKANQGGNGTMAPGEFGLLATPAGDNGASAIEQALAAVKPSGCYSSLVQTAPGSKTQQVRTGINTRFSGSTEAPDVEAYPRDSALQSGSSGGGCHQSNPIMGSGDWDIDSYWQTEHGTSAPAALAGATRYQAYLYEQGLTFARNGKRTLYPVPKEMPEGYTEVTPDKEDLPVGGAPAGSVAANGQARRLIRVAVLQCQADSVEGSHQYSPHGKYVQMFITEEVGSPPNAAIYGEIVKPLNPEDDPAYHANVHLVQ